MQLFGRRRTVAREETTGARAESLRQQADGMDAISESINREMIKVSQNYTAIREARSGGSMGQTGGAGQPGNSTRDTYPASEGLSDSTLKSSYLTVDSSNRSRKVALYQAMLGESYVSAAIEAIAARMVSGGWTLKPVDAKHPKPKTKAWLQEYFDWCNPDEELNQILHSQITDLGWCGECYLEVTWTHSQTLNRDIPYEIYTVDPISMDYILADDRKSIIGYVQNVDNQPKVKLDTTQIIRTFLPDPRNRFRSLGQLEKLLNPVTLDTYLQLSELKYFHQGNWSDIAITLNKADKTQAERFITWLSGNFLGVKNSHKPLILFGEEGDVKIDKVGDRSKLDIIQRRNLCRDEILAVYKVPPRMVSIMGGTGLGGNAEGDSVDKQFVHTAVDPWRQRLLGQINFKIGTLGFGVQDWELDTTYADMRDTKEVIEIAKEKIAIGISTINQELAENKLEPVEGGDVPIMILGSTVVPIASLPNMPVKPGDKPIGPDPEALAKAGAAPGGPGGPPKPGQPAKGQPAPPEDPEDAKPPWKAPKAGSAPRESLREAEDATHEYGCILAPLSGEPSRRLAQVRDSLPEWALSKDGREQDAHTTVIYGLHEPERDGELATLIASMTPAMSYSLGELRTFPGEDYDVIVADVLCPELTTLHQRFRGLLPNTQSFPDYVPHATLAYVKAGLGAILADLYRSTLTGTHGIIATLDLCDRYGHKIGLHLTGDQTGEPGNHPNPHQLPLPGVTILPQDWERPDRGREHMSALQRQILTEWDQEARLEFLEAVRHEQPGS